MKFIKNIVRLFINTYSAWVGDEYIAEEIVQETFLVAALNTNKFRNDCKITSWLCQISKYIWIKKLRKKKKIDELPIDDFENSLTTNELVDEILVSKENKIQLFQKIQKFDENTRNVMYLRILGNFEYSEIGEIMNRSSNWARVVFFRGKQKLKEEFENEEWMWYCSRSVIWL